jgi:catalase
MATQLEKKPAPSDALIRDLLDAFDKVFGLHPGFRPAHAKGVMCSGTFAPSPAAARLTRAPHAARPSTPVVVRFSNSAGVPDIPDNSPEGAGPRGMAVRFYLADHVHTDLVAHSHHGFGVRTGEEMLEMLRAVAASGPDAPHPTPIERFLGAHPRTLAHVQAPKPIPTSFAREHFFAMNAFEFVNGDGARRFGRFRILPEAGTEYLSADDAARQSPNFLMDEIAARLAREPVRFHVRVQLADPGDETADATVNWPEGREQVDFGTVTLTKFEDSSQPELRKIIFDPVPRVDGIDPSADPLIEVRSAIYLLSGRRRRAASGI